MSARQAGDCARAGDQAVILFSLGGWRKGRLERRSLEEMRSSLPRLAEGGGWWGVVWARKKIDKTAMERLYEG